MSPSVRPEGRPSRGVCKIGSDTDRTAHFRAVGAQRAALIPDVRPVAPTKIGWPIWPVIDRARPCECHGKNTHVTAAAVGVCWHRPRTERLRLTPCHRRCQTCGSPTHYWGFSSNQRELALGADAGCLVLSWNHSKTTPYLLVRLKYRHTTHHAAASLSFKFVSAPLDVAHDTNATRPTARITAPPCPSHTRRTRGTGHAGAFEAGFVFRVVVVASSSARPVGCSGIIRNAATTRKRSAPPRNATSSDLKWFGAWAVLERVWWPIPLRCARWPARWARAFFLFGVFQYDLGLGA